MRNPTLSSFSYPYHVVCMLASYVAAFACKWSKVSVTSAACLGLSRTSGGGRPGLPLCRDGAC
eukprot:scaffold400121_cov39-Prasinocladus_malaysianus.AAC.2